MSSNTWADLAPGMELTVTDLAALVTTLLLTINAVARFRRSRTENPGLLRANLAMILVLICSVSIVYETIDPLLGGISALNLIAHLLMVYTGWEISASTAKTLNRFNPSCANSLLVHPWVPVAASVGTITAYLALSPSSSRGLEDYDQELAYLAYWAATVWPLILGAFHIVPRMVHIGPKLRQANWLATASLVMLWLAFIGVLVTIAAFIITAAQPEFWVVREFIVTSTLLLFTAAFLVSTAALPRPTRTGSRRLRRAETPTGSQ